LFTFFYQLPALTLGLLIKRLKVWPQVRFFLLWPGTVVHEFLHWFVAFLTNGNPTKISVWPQRAPNGNWVLGGVAISNLTWYNGLVIGLAPMLGIVLILLLTPKYLGWHFSLQDVYQWVITAPLWVMCWPSSMDLQIGFQSGKGMIVSILLFVLAALYWSLLSSGYWGT
jgi:hypothetical protein